MLLCQRCIKYQKSCCNGPNITLTLGDVSRITLASGQRDFVEFKVYSDLSFLEAYAYDPNWKEYTFSSGNRNRQMKMNTQGDCPFLGADGCTLSEDDRPLICRLYPYSYNEFGMIGLILNEDLFCPLHLLKAGETLPQMLEITSEQADRWRTMLYTELRAESLEREKKGG
jgi:uncharacterized protein